MNVLITGGAGVLGSGLVDLFLKRGDKVTVIDVCRKEEAWRLFDVFDRIKYLWKSETDIHTSDLRDIDVVVDCAIGYADRPFGNESPRTTFQSNISPSLNLLTSAKKMENKPIMIYPSSFNALYGHFNSTITENTLPLPTSIYGWTKASTELLYLTYYFSYNVPVIITRTSSTFGPGGRSDEFPHRLMISIISGDKDFPLRSPNSKRLWTYSQDAFSFYGKLTNVLETYPEKLIGQVLHLGGNAGDRNFTNSELAKIIKKVSGSDINIKPEDYEPGELVEGMPISFLQDARKTRELLNWNPKWELEDSLKETFHWFYKYRDRYGIV